MLSFITSPNCFAFPPRLDGVLKFQAISWPLVVVFNPRRTRPPGRRCGAACFDLDYGSLRFGDLRRRQQHYQGSWCCGCKGWESDGDLALEAEILEFMKNSEKPGVFPTKKELMDEGRMDLVDAIVKQGGWLSMGWDLDNETEDKTIREIEGESDNGALLGGGIRDFQQRIEEGNQESNPCGGVVEVMPTGIPPISGNFPESPSSSGGSL